MKWNEISFTDCNFIKFIRSIPLCRPTLGRVSLIRFFFPWYLDEWTKEWMIQISLYFYWVKFSITIWDTIHSFVHSSSYHGEKNRIGDTWLRPDRHNGIEQMNRKMRGSLMLMLTAMPKIYGLIKIHKPGFPIQPVTAFFTDSYSWLSPIPQNSRQK